MDQMDDDYVPSIGELLGMNNCSYCEDLEEQRDQLNKRISELEEMRDRIVDFLIKNETEKESITLKGILFIINDDYQKIEKRKR